MRDPKKKFQSRTHLTRNNLAMKHLPDKIRFNALTVQVCAVERLGEDVFGLSSVHPSPTVSIDQSLDEKSKAMTLIHELLHVVSESYSLELSESQVCTLEQAITMILFQNPGLAKTIQDAIQGRYDSVGAIPSINPPTDTPEQKNAV